MVRTNVGICILMRGFVGPGSGEVDVDTIVPDTENLKILPIPE